MPKLTFVKNLAYAVCVGVLFRPVPARAEPSDPWWGPDKALHFAFSGGIAAASYGAASLSFEERWVRVGVGLSTAVAVGGLKELYDATGHGTASYKDLTWDVAGALCGVGLALLLDAALDRPERPGSRSSQRTPGLSVRF